MIRWVAAFFLFPVLASAQQAFQLPSGNIHCVSYAGELRCDIIEFSYRRPPPPPGCEEGWGSAITLGAKGPARVICHGDTVANEAHPVLGYGQAWQGPGMACTAARTGLRCTNGDGRGFEMSRARLRFF